MTITCGIYSESIRISRFVTYAYYSPVTSHFGLPSYFWFHIILIHFESFRNTICYITTLRKGISLCRLPHPSDHKLQSTRSLFKCFLHETWETFATTPTKKSVFHLRFFCGNFWGEFLNKNKWNKKKDTIVDVCNTRIIWVEWENLTTFQSSSDDKKGIFTFSTIHRWHAHIYFRLWLFVDRFRKENKTWKITFCWKVLIS